MAYFECVIGSAASGGSGADLIVTCDANFAGSTITCTDGNTTFTEVCPSSSPYEVTFESIPTGTWTISGVSGGQTFTQSVTITDFTASLHDIPDGATVTPTDDIQTWLHCANIFNKSYTTISQVLSDTSTLLALISSNNAADYMARSTSWASSVCANQTAMGYIGNNNYCANKLLSDSTWCTAICNSTYFESVLNVKVPTMTSDTTPSGQVIYSSKYSNAYSVFDSDTGTYWFPSAGTGINAYIGYKFTSAIKVRKWRLLPLSCESQQTVSFILQGSNDNSNWTNIGTAQSVTYYTGTNTTNYKTVSIVNNTAYKYYRLKVASGELHSAGMYSAKTSIIQFWGRA